MTQRKFYDGQFDLNGGSGIPVGGKERTAMAQLKDKLQVVVDSLKDAVPETDQYGYRSAMENVIKDIDAQMLELERKQIVEAAKEECIELLKFLRKNTNTTVTYYLGLRAKYNKDILDNEDIYNPFKHEAEFVEWATEHGFQKHIKSVLNWFELVKENGWAFVNGNWEHIDEQGSYTIREVLSRHPIERDDSPPQINQRWVCILDKQQCQDSCEFKDNRSKCPKTVLL
jgi:hypothetical protein